MKNLIERYLLEEPNPAYAQEIQTLSDGEVADRLKGQWRFGTAGFRAKMEAGYLRFNRVSVSKMAYALGKYLKTGSTISIGFDGRHHSQEYALLVAQILNAGGHHSLLFSHMVPTPLCAFSVTALKADAGVMVTASHNPPQDNGIKIYGPAGAQLMAPDTQAIEAILDQAPAYQDIARDKREPQLVPEWVMEEYFSALITSPPTPLHPVERGVKIIYTPMHGVGALYALRALKQVGFEHVTVVPSQAKPDGDFPTLKFPNPEEPGALDQAIALARESKADLILANDPDADRLAVCIGDKVLTGNQIGILLGSYLIELNSHPGQRPGIQPGPRLKAGVTTKRPLVITTYVSSRMLSQIALKNQVSYAETLTGFANIAHAALEREAKFNEELLFSYEEALGYCIGNRVRDKDGISAAVLFAQFFASLQSQHRTVFEELDRLSLTYGLYRNLSWSTRGELKEILARAENFTGFVKQKSPPPGLLVYTGAHDLRLIIRPSGTEQKIKFYTEVIAHPKDASELQVMTQQLDLFLESVRGAVTQALKV